MVTSRSAAKRSPLWPLRRNDKEVGEQLRKYLFTDGEITEAEKKAKPKE